MLFYLCLVVLFIFSAYIENILVHTLRTMHGLGLGVCEQVSVSVYLPVCLLVCLHSVHLKKKEDEGLIDYLFENE